MNVVHHVNLMRDAIQTPAPHVSTLQIRIVLTYSKILMRRIGEKNGTYRPQPIHVLPIVKPMPIVLKPAVYALRVTMAVALISDSVGRLASPTTLVLIVITREHVLFVTTKPEFAENPQALAKNHTIVGGHVCMIGIVEAVAELVVFVWAELVNNH